MKQNGLQAISSIQISTHAANILHLTLIETDDQVKSLDLFFDT